MKIMEKIIKKIKKAKNIKKIYKNDGGALKLKTILF
jgi:hypothetical protein